MPTYFSIPDIKQHHYDPYVSESRDIKCQEMNLLCTCVLASWQCVKPYRYQLSPASWYSRSQFGSHLVIFKKSVSGAHQPWIPVVIVNNLVPLLINGSITTIL